MESLSEQERQGLLKQGELMSSEGTTPIITFVSPAPSAPPADEVKTKGQTQKYGKAATPKPKVPAVDSTKNGGPGANKGGWKGGPKKPKQQYRIKGGTRGAKDDRLVAESVRNSNSQERGNKDAAREKREEAAEDKPEPKEDKPKKKEDLPLGELHHGYGDDPEGPYDAYGTREWIPGRKWERFHYDSNGRYRLFASEFSEYMSYMVHLSLAVWTALSLLLWVYDQWGSLFWRDGYALGLSFLDYAMSFLHYLITERFVLRLVLTLNVPIYVSMKLWVVFLDQTVDQVHYSKFTIVKRHYLPGRYDWRSQLVSLSEIKHFDGCLYELTLEGYTTFLKFNPLRLRWGPFRLLWKSFGTRTYWVSMELAAQVLAPNGVNNTHLSDADLEKKIHMAISNCHVVNIPRQGVLINQCWAQHTADFAVWMAFKSREERLEAVFH